MAALIITILVVYVGWLVVRPLLAAYLRRKMAEKVEDAFARQFGMPNAREARRQYEEQRRQYEEAAKAAERRRRKIFSRDEGEYIEFEEITVTTTTTYSAPTNFRVEDQVSDAEWEELK